MDTHPVTGEVYVRGAFDASVGKTIPVKGSDGTVIGSAVILDADGAVRITLDDGTTSQAAMWRPATGPARS